MIPANSPILQSGPAGRAECGSGPLQERVVKMLLASRCAAAATAFFLFSTVESPAASGFCEDAAELSVLPSPVAPWKGAPLRVMVVSEKPLEGVLSLTAPDGSVAAKAADRHGGPPYSWFAEVAE